MRIVVSGTHASGKSTLISDFALRHPQYTVLPDPFDLVDETGGSFVAQLRIAADRLIDEPSRGPVIAERGPLDFVAYLLAAAELDAVALDDALLHRARERTAEALRGVDVLIVLPLAANDPIHVGFDEHPALRTRMNDILLELLDDPDLIGDDLVVAEITGTPDERLAALEALVGGRGGAAAHPSRA